MEQTEQYKYFAFISYNAKDTEWGKRVQRKLEHYRMPATLCSEHGWKRRPISPVFFAPTDIQPGGLTEELQARLRASRNLIVICSPHSAKSQWVGKEIAFFHQLGRTRNIHFFIVDGVPHSGNEDTECLNPVVDSLGLPEILGANVNERIYRYPWMNRERAYVQLITKLLGVEFDTIWQRHKRLLVQRAVAWAVGMLAVAAALLGVWIANQPVCVEMRLHEVSAHNAELPPLSNAVVTMTLDNETKTDTIRRMDGTALLRNVPHRLLGQRVRVAVACRDYVSVDTTVTLARVVTVGVRRDPTVYGRVRFRLWDMAAERAVAGAEVTVGGVAARSDADGMVAVDMALAAQRKAYPVTSGMVRLACDTVYMPCGESDVVLVEP